MLCWDNLCLGTSVISSGSPPPRYGMAKSVTPNIRVYRLNLSLCHHSLELPVGRSARGLFFFFFTYVNSHYTFKDFGNIICSLTFSSVWMFSISRIVLRSSVAFAHSSEALVQPSPTPSCAQSLQAAIPEQPHAGCGSQVNRCFCVLD